MVQQILKGRVTKMLITLRKHKQNIKTDLLQTIEMKIQPQIFFKSIKGTISTSNIKERGNILESHI